MKYRLVELLVCPCCGDSLDVLKYETKQNNFRIPAKIYCNTYCAFLDKKVTVTCSDMPCEKCYNIEIWEGFLQCSKCGASYPIINGIPRLLRNEFLVWIAGIYKQCFSKYKLVIKDTGNVDNTLKVKKHTMEAFGREWLDFNKMYKEYENQFLIFIYPIKPDFFKDKLVLDAGCGSGRHVYYSSSYGAEVVGIDLSLGVETAYKNTIQFPFVYIIQADIYHLPLHTEIFDLVYSVGVLHHLPAPEKAFQNLIRYTKKGGNVFAWVYGKENNSRFLYFIDPIRKSITRNLPLIATKGLSFVLTVPFYLVLKLIYSPLNKINQQLSERILPINQHFYQLSTFTFSHVFSIVFDHLIAPIAFYYTGEEFQQWFEHAKLKNVKINWCRRNSWGGIGEKV